MADLSKDDLLKEIAGILKGADLKSTSSKKVRQQLEEKLDCSLQSRKQEIDDLVMEYLTEQPKSKKYESGSEDGEEEEGEEDEVSEEEEKKKPAKREPAKKAAAKRKKASSDEDESASASDDDDSDGDWKAPAKKGKGKAAAKKGKKTKKDDSDSDSDWGAAEKKAASPKKRGAAAGGAKRGGGGYTRPLKLSAELAAVVGSDQMARHEVVKKLWSVIREKNLFDPKNKQFAICDDELFKVMGIKRFRCFAMMKYLKNHFVD